MVINFKINYFYAKLYFIFVKFSKVLDFLLCVQTGQGSSSGSVALKVEPIYVLNGQFLCQDLNVKSI